MYRLTLAISIIIPSAALMAEEPKEHLVLMPLKGKGMSKLELSIYRSAIAEGLSEKYSVFTGDDVDNKIREVFEKESRESLECDATKCYQDIAIAFQAELLVTATIIPKQDQYLLRLEINNIIDNKVVMASSESCEKCSDKKLLAMLKIMASGNKEQLAELKKPRKKTKWWLWTLLGVVVVGGAAALSSSGSESGNSSDSGGNKNDNTVIVSF